MLMTWRYKEPGSQEAWYLLTCILSTGRGSWSPAGRFTNVGLYTICLCPQSEIVTPDLGQSLKLSPLI